MTKPIMSHMTFQDEGAQFLASRTTGLLGDEMGLGKTYQCLMAINHIVASECNDRTVPFKVCIVCPAFLIPQWKEEINRHVVAPGRFDIRCIVSSYDMVTRDVKALATDLEYYMDILVLDEAHYLKSIDSKRTAAILKKDGIAHYAKRVWYMTGTPMMNRPVELYPILKSSAPLKLGAYTDYFDFTKRYCDGKEGKYGWEAKGCRYTEELSKMLSGFMLRRTKKEVLNLPPVLPEIIYVAIDPKMIQQILFEQHIIEEDRLAEGELPEIGSIATLRRLIGLAKRDSVLEQIHNVLETRENVCVFAWHTELIDYLADRTDAAVVKGGMTAEQKHEAKNAFTKGEKRVFIGQIKASGEGINGLQEVCSHMIMAEPDWSPKSMEQVIGRLDRMGQKGDSVVVQFMVGSGTLEETIMKVQRIKNVNIERIIQ